MATTIYTYLHNDDLNGSRIVSMDDCMCKLYTIMRDDSDFMKDFEKDLQSPALYILVNRDESKAYIGETDDFIKRIAHHIIQKDFWKEVLVFLGTNEGTLSKTEVQYLEYLALEKAKAAHSFDLSENTQGGKIPHMNVMQKGKTDKFFKYVQFLSKFVDCGIFENRSNNESSKPKVLPSSVSLTSEDLKETVKSALNGEGKYSKNKVALQIKNNELKNFWECVYELTQKGELAIERDFRIGNEMMLKTDIVYKEFFPSKLILYIRPSRFFPLYQKQCHKLGKTFLSRTSLKYYLESSKEYFGHKNAMRFKFIVRGQTQTLGKKKEDENKMSSKSPIDRVMCFDYEAVMNNYGIDINSYVPGDIPDE